MLVESRSVYSALQALWCERNLSYLSLCNTGRASYYCHPVATTRSFWRIVILAPKLRRDNRWRSVLKCWELESNIHIHASSCFNQKPGIVAVVYFWNLVPKSFLLFFSPNA